jgi:hypothetical protein
LADPALQRAKYPSLHEDADYEAYIRAQVAAELQQKVKQVEILESPTTMRVSGDSVPESHHNLRAT